MICSLSSSLPALRPRRLLPLLTCFAVGLWLAAGAFAAEALPPRPSSYFNDSAGVVSPSTAQSLNRQLAQFERETSNQIVVAVFPRMQSASSVEDYTVRVAQSWRVGQKDRNNGAILFVFVQERQLYIQVGYGLEPVLPDALAFQIIEREVKPHLRSGDFDAGLRAGVNAMMAASRGEYQGTGRTAGETRGRRERATPLPVTLLVIVLIIVGALRSGRRGFRGPRGPWSGTRGPRGFGGGLGGFGGFGGGSSGGGFGGGGGFSGGGGGFGGGGAGGRW